MGCFSILRFCGSDSKGKQQNNWGEEEEEEHIWVPAKKKPSYGSSVSGLSSSQSQSQQPPPSPSGQLGGKTLSEVEHEQSKHAVAVAIATAAAAEAAVAVARAAAQIVRLTGNSSSFHQAEAGRQEYAATKIQSAFRGYLARKELRALKGLVKLQALIRGRSVRRKAEETLKSMQALQRIQSDACFRRSRASDGRRASHESVDVKRQLHSRKPVLEMKGDKGWNSSRLSKEEIEMILSSRKEAAFKRERAKEYALDKQEGRNSRASISMSAVVRGHHVGSAEWNWVERWIETQIYKQAQSSSMSSIDHNSLSDKQIIEAKAYIESIDKEEVQSKPSFMEHPPIKDPRRSQSPVPRPRKSVQRSPSRDDESFASSTASLPNFMVQTESAKAKARSSSTPKQRTRSVGRTSDQKSFTKAMYAAIGSDAGVPKLRRSPSSQTMNSRPSLDKIKSAFFKDLPVDSKQSQESCYRRNSLR